MDYQSASAKFGTVEHNGVTLALTQQAYANNYGTNGGERYCATLVDEVADEVSEIGEVLGLGEVEVVRKAG